MQYVLIGLLVMSAPWDYSIHFTKDFHTNLLKKLGKTCQFCKLLRCHKTQMWKRVLNWKRKPWRRMYGVNWMVGNSIPRSVQTGPRSTLARAGSRFFWGWLKIFWAVSIFFWPCLRDILWLAQFFLSWLNILFGLPQDTGCFFRGAP